MTTRHAHLPLRALSWMILSALGFALMSLFVKKLAPVVPQFQLVFFRSVVNFVIAAALVLAWKQPLFPPHKKLLLFRGLLGFGGVTCFFYGISHLPLPIAGIINWSSPVFVLLFSRLFLKEQVSPSALIWILLALTGLVLLLKPDFSSKEVFELPLSAVLIAVIGAAFAGGAYVTVRAATAKVSVSLIILYFTGTATLLSAPLAFRDLQVPRTEVLFQLFWLGLFASVGQFAMTQGYRFAPAGLVSTMSLMNAAFMAFLGWVAFGEVLSPIQWLGMLILAVGISALALKRR